MRGIFFINTLSFVPDAYFHLFFSRDQEYSEIFPIQAIADGVGNQIKQDSADGILISIYIDIPFGNLYLHLRVPLSQYAVEIGNTLPADLACRYPGQFKIHIASLYLRQREEFFNQFHQLAGLLLYL